MRARALAAGSGRIGDGDLLVALDGTASDGLWVLDERLRKINALIKHSRGSATHGWSVGMTGDRASWNATDQVPLRAIECGQISRYGFIDPYLGGATTRVGLTANVTLGSTRINLYALAYRFRLLSNFTYFLDDPVRGDEFAQRDRREVLGG